MNTYFAVLASLWVTVTPDTMLTVKVPEFSYTGIPGSVTNQYRHKPQEADGCPVLERGRVVGWSLACFPPPARSEQADRF